jgi:hypothetical protein
VPRASPAPVQVVETTKIMREPIPETLLRPCPVDPLPQRGISNIELAVDDRRRHAAQIACNRRFDELREWQQKLEETR